MKKLFIYSIVSFLIFMAALFTYSFTQSQPAKATNENNFVEFTYTITLTKELPDGNIGYFGEAEDGTGIYFTSDDVQSIGAIKKGNTVKAYFDPNDTIEGLLYVVKESK